MNLLQIIYAVYKMFNILVRRTLNNKSQIPNLEDTDTPLLARSQ